MVTATGIAGLTLNGGMRHLRRQYGLSCDNLISAELVTADGEVLTASAVHNEELFWALRGGGGSFGVVTSFAYRLHEVGPDVTVLFVWYRGEEAVDVLRGFPNEAEELPNEVSVLAFYAFVLPDEAFPGEAHGQAADDEANIAWAREGIAEARTLPGASGSHGNFPGFLEDSAHATYGDHYERLRATKTQYDSTNFFRYNLNIEPAM